MDARDRGHGLLYKLADLIEERHKDELASSRPSTTQADLSEPPTRLPRVIPTALRLLCGLGRNKIHGQTHPEPGQT